VLLAVIAIVAFLVIGVLLLGSSSAGDLSSLFESVI
jgi:preprotein translocase subunit SecG